MQRSLETYLNAEPLPFWRASAFLRAVFVAAFAAQVVVAVAVGVLVSAMAPGTPRPNAFLGWVLVALAMMQIPTAVLVASRLGTASSRRAVLSRVILTAVVLASTAWFAVLAVATAQQGASVYLLFGLLASAYGLGFITVGRLARSAAALAPDSKDGEDDPTDEDDEDFADPGVTESHPS